MTKSIEIWLVYIVSNTLVFLVLRVFHVSYQYISIASFVFAHQIYAYFPFGTNDFNVVGPPVFLSYHYVWGDVQLLFNYPSCLQLNSFTSMLL